MVILTEEIQTAININVISWLPEDGGLSIYENVEIHMGLCANDELSTDFSGNYIPGTKVLVFQAGNLELNTEPNEWMSIPLDNSFQYDCEENLLIEIIHESGCVGHIDCWSWNAGPNRVIKNESSNPDLPGSPTNIAPVMLLLEASSLESVTFGTIKTKFGEI